MLFARVLWLLIVLENLVPRVQSVREESSLRSHIRDIDTWRNVDTQDANDWLRTTFLGLEVDSGNIFQTDIGFTSKRDRKHLSSPSLSLRNLRHRFLPESTLHYSDSISLLRRRGNKATTVPSPSPSKLGTNPSHIFPFGVGGYSQSQSPIESIAQNGKPHPQGSKESNIFPFSTPSTPSVSQPQPLKSTTSLEPESPGRRLASVSSNPLKVANSHSSLLSSSSGVYKSGSLTFYSGSVSHTKEYSNSESSGSRKNDSGSRRSGHSNTVSSGSYQSGHSDPLSSSSYQSGHSDPISSESSKYSPGAHGSDKPGKVQTNLARTKIVLAAPRRGMRTAGDAENHSRVRYEKAQLQHETVRLGHKRKRPMHP